MRVRAQSSAALSTRSPKPCPSEKRASLAKTRRSNERRLLLAGLMMAVARCQINGGPGDRVEFGVA